MKKVISALLALAMILSIVPFNVFAEEKTAYSDMKTTDYYATAATALSELDIIEGYPDGTFGAEKGITRAEVAAIACRMIDKSKDAETAKGQTKFDDVAIGYWASGYINVAAQENIINGDGDGNFRPEDDITYEEAIKIIVCVLGLGKDIKVDPADWSAGYLAVAKDKGLTKDLKGKKGDVATRGDVAVMTYNGMTFDLKAPVASLEAGSYTGTKSVTLKTETEGAEIYYTTDGSAPTVKSTKYTKAISISKTSTLKAIAVKKGVLVSDVMSVEYTIKRSFGGGGGSISGGSGSSGGSSNNSSTYTRGEWVELLGEKLEFDMSIDKGSIDYVYADTEQSKYGIAIEIAEAYGILPIPTSDGFEDSEQDIPYFYPDELATREFVAYTVAEAMGFSGEYSLDECTDLNDTLYPNQVSVVVEQGFMGLTATKFNPKAPIKSNDKDTIFNKIDEFNDSLKVDTSEPHENVEFVSGVKKDELSGIVDYSTVLNDDNTITVIVPKTEATSAIKADDIIILPPNKDHIAGIALKVSTIADNGNTITITATEPDISEVVSNIDYAGVAHGDAANFEPSEDVTVEYNPTGSIEDEDEDYPLNIKAGGSVSVPGKLKFTLASKKLSENVKASGSVSIEIPDITAKVNASIGLFSGVDINELVLSIKEKIKFSGEISYTLAESGYEITNSNGNTRWEAGQVELGRLPVPLGSTGLSIDIVFFYTVNAKGTASISYTMVATQGIQVINGSFRTIKDFTQSLDAISLQGSFRAGLGIGVVLDAFELMDLIGVDAHAGLGVNASFTVHAISTGALYCGDGTVYLYGTLELDPETAFGKFIKTVLHASWSWDFFTEKNSPLKLKLHIENGHKVPACTYGVGGINGYVKDADTGNAIPNARVTILSENATVKTLYTDASGNFNSTNMAASNYKLKVSATGYNTYTADITVEKDSVTYIETLMMLNRSYNGDTGTVVGTVMDAVTGSTIANATCTVRKNWNTTYGEIVQSVQTDDDGSYSFDLPVGNYTIQLEKDGYTSTSVNIIIKSNATTEGHAAMSPESSTDFGAGIRIILTWQNEPSDLDSHLFGPTTDGQSYFHTYFESKDYIENGDTIANLDRDDTDYIGPETTTIYTINGSGIYSFYVHDYTNRGSSNSDVLSKSGAKVTVYDGNSIKATYIVPLNKNGTLWHVFDYDASTGSLRASNDFSYSDTPSARPSDVSLISMNNIGENSNADVSKLTEILDGLDGRTTSVANQKVINEAKKILENPASQDVIDATIERLQQIEF